MHKGIFTLSLLLFVSIATWAGDGIKIGVLLPFSGAESRVGKMVEFYRGVLMAVDSVSTRYGRDIEVVALDCGDTRERMEQLLASHGELRTCHFIIGPQSSLQVNALSDYCHRAGVRLVVPFTQLSAPLANELLYAVSAPRDLSNRTALTLAQALFRGCHYVSLSLSDERQSANSLHAQLLSDLRRRGVSVSLLSDTASDEQIKAAFSTDKRNVVIADGTSLSAVNRVMSVMDAVSGLCPDSEITVIGDYDWQNYIQQHLHNYYKYDVHIPVTYFRNALSTDNVAFENRYLKAFSTQMLNTMPRFAPMGFDVAYYFLDAVLRYGIDGTGIEDRVGSLYSEQRPFQHSLDFVMTTQGFWSNQACRFVHYAPDGTIQLMSK